MRAYTVVSAQTPLLLPSTWSSVAEGWRTETEPQLVHERGARNLRLLAARVATHCQSLARAAGTDGGAGAAAAAAVGGRLRLPPELPGVRCGTAAQNTRVAGVYTDQLATNRFSNPMLDHVREEAHGFATLDRWVLQPPSEPAQYIVSAAATAVPRETYSDTYSVPWLSPSCAQLEFPQGSALPHRFPPRTPLRPCRRCCAGRCAAARGNRRRVSSPLRCHVANRVEC